MNVILYISALIVPLMFVGIIAYGLSKGVAVFDTFIEGAVEGMKTTAKIFPTLLGLMIAVGVLRSSGTLEVLVRIVAKPMHLLGFPKEALPITIMRLISSSASTGLLLDVFQTYGPDSFIGRFVSVMMSSTETILYTLSVYFLSVKITNSRYTLAGALVANLAGVIASLIITQLVFY